MDIQYECDNAFPNLKCVPDPFLKEKAPTLYLKKAILKQVVD